MWFDSIAGTDGLASTAGPTVVSPGRASPVGRAVAVVLGYWFPGDGGGGMFFWDAASEANPDGGTVFAISCYPLGRWIRVAEGPVSVKWFGARVDGKHNDREAVQAALGTGAGVVLIPAGICAIYDAPLSIPAGTTLMGAGSGATTLQQCTPGQEVVRLTDATNASLVGMAVVSSGAAHAVHAVAVPNPDVPEVEHVTFRDVWVQPGFGSPGISITAVDGSTFHAPAHGLSNDQIVQLSAGSPHLGASTNLAFSVDGKTISGIGDTGPMDHGLKGGDPVQFVDVEDANILPQGLSAFTKYYVVNPTATTFQVSAKRDGEAIAFTGGTGLPLTVYVWPMVPGGFYPYLEYFVVNATADTFELSLTRSDDPNPILITDAPASTCTVGVVYAGILLESAGKNLYSPRIRDCKVDGGQQCYTDGSARHGIRAISTPDPGNRIPANVVGATVIGGETANLKAGVSALAGAEIIAVAHHVYNISDATGGGTAFAASGNNALQGSDNRIEGGAGAVERAVLFYPELADQPARRATGCSLRATPGFQTWQILDLSGPKSNNSWWLALDSNVQNQQAGAFTYAWVGFYYTAPYPSQPTPPPSPPAPTASATYGSNEMTMLNEAYAAYSAVRDVGLLEP